MQPKGEAGCIHRRGINRCARGRALTSPEDIVVSPDGRHVYVAAYSSHSIAAFARNRRTGSLEQLGTEVVPAVRTELERRAASAA